MNRANSLKILEYGFYLLIFLLPLQTRWMFKLGELNKGYWEYGTMSLYATDILFICLLVCYFINSLVYGGRLKICGLRFKIFWWIIAGLELFVFISVFFAFDRRLALYGYGRFLLGIGLFFLVSRLKYDKLKLYWAIAASGVAQSVLAMWQFAVQRVYASKWLGMAAQNPVDLGVSVVETGLRRWLRAYGSLPHPNILGGFLAICLLINIILYFDLHKKFTSAADEHAVKKYKLGLLTSLLFFIANFAGLLLTFSRSAWLALAVGIIILIPLAAQKYKKIGVLNLSKFIFAIILLSGIFAYGLQEPVKTRLNITGRLENKSARERADYNKEAWQVVKSNWLFGVGMYNYGLAVADEARKGQPAYSYQPAHNTFLLIWSEIGLFGLMFFIGLLVAVLLNCCIIKLPRYESNADFMLIAAMAVMMFFDHWWWSLGFGMMLAWLIWGIAIAGKNKNGYLK